MSRPASVMTVYTRRPLSLRRSILYFAYLTLLRFTPEDYRPYALFFPALRRLLVRAFVESSGPHLRVKHGADISPFIRIGDHSELGTRCMIQSDTQMGSYVIMGPDVKIYTRNHRFESIEVPIATQGKRSAAVRIGDDVWLGANVVITPGVSVGNHVVIAAGAVVTDDIPDYAVVAGVPARVLKYRNA